MCANSRSKPPALDLGKRSKAELEKIAYHIVSPGLPPLSDRNMSRVRQSKSIEAEQKRLINERAGSTSPAEGRRSPGLGVRKDLPRLQRAKPPPPLDIRHGRLRHGLAMRSAPLRGHRVLTRPYPPPQPLYAPLPGYYPHYPPAYPLAYPTAVYPSPPLVRYHQVTMDNGDYVVVKTPSSDNNLTPEEMCEDNSAESSLDDDVESRAIEDGAVPTETLSDPPAEEHVALVSGDLRLGSEVYTYEVPVHEKTSDFRKHFLRLAGAIFDDYIARAGN
ncbi:hypothetical protein KL930_000906 [Ogataea haglerorum]|uniref:Uncharacterized protein n=1 Tax=Ogataea haglerorum TaxID=1937702 RepID=A0ABQ7RNF9_9ASCO|nr:hypothetical protein KL915_000907 [Ogataea haglerorum]KAG7701876.1 hypothetical protein KL951_000332 [Ogataea haglerorum]KAG7711689.1 hypothetical protein KL914_000331 [Ogataea haglerorum]KAG7712461.1 hypothetical protein KL950_000332 [Ogataea haglerorum]KAG7722513.1 hypothetical protein KL913_000333 [Ogataea haglerorum]